MALRKLTEDGEERFSTIPEFAMGIQYSVLKGDLVAIVGGQIVVTTADISGLYESVLDLPFYQRDLNFPDARTRFTNWKEGLDEVEDVEAVHPVFGKPNLIGFIMTPTVISPAHPGTPQPPYGHLPFTGSTQPGDTYYRCEPYPTSRRLIAPNTIAAGTYAIPQSEDGFYPTGFSAVGRYALPCFFPACYKWTINPTPGPVNCGTVVPQFGQAGGGVEIMFAAVTTNIKTFKPPVVLPPL